jgi:replication factor A2
MHSDAEFVIDDHEVTQVTFVAQVKSIVPQATNIVYALVDGTGQIEARHWAQAQPGSEELQQREDVKWVIHQPLFLVTY